MIGPDYRTVLDVSSSSFTRQLQEPGYICPRALSTRGCGGICFRQEGCLPPFLLGTKELFGQEVSYVSRYLSFN
jgi:hypothetical protein